ncbi:Asp-tRNA(Asn)/Glu-tRNA(Gln) amidotransferase subunit GatC [Patescibacteria group bacterium]|nr:Asp-tRNA(Asn)/Glu-tRNA(Gln) amidotransferase subunit GatC [Patescibacteria group bacterium]
MIKKKEVEKLAELSRIEISYAEKETLTKEIESILAYISEIQKVSSDILASDGQLLTNVMREDKDPHESGVFTDVLLEAMPKEEKGFLKVKKILNQE